LFAYVFGTRSSDHRARHPRRIGGEAIDLVAILMVGNPSYWEQWFDATGAWQIF